MYGLRIKANLLPKRYIEIPGTNLSEREREKEILSYIARYILKINASFIGSFL